MCGGVEGAWLDVPLQWYGVWLCELSLQRFPGDEGGQRETPPPLKFLVVVIYFFVCVCAI